MGEGVEGVDGIGCSGWLSSVVGQTLKVVAQLVPAWPLEPVAPKPERQVAVTPQNVNRSLRRKWLRRLVSCAGFRPWLYT